MTGNASKSVLLVGTRKGLWIGTSDEQRFDWAWTGPHFNMEEVYSCMLDTRGASLRVCSWVRPRVGLARRCGDPTTSERPGRRPPTERRRFPEDVDATLARVWQLVPGTSPGVVHAGTEPGAIFTSVDNGETFELERALWDHPHREQWQAGFGGQAFHTLLPHPTDSDSLVAALSTGGVYRTSDSGAHWEPANQGIKAEFFPGERNYPEFGQCVHKVARHPSNPDRLFLQNHGGVYRSDDGGDSWVDIAPGLPAEFGFPIVVHPHEPDTVFVFPLSGAESRFPVDAKATVWRSVMRAPPWEPLNAGLPEAFYVGVMRDAMCTDTWPDVGIYLGARNGAVHASTDGGDTWHEIVRDLPDVAVVRAYAL